MPDSTSRLPARPSLEQLRKQAKELLKNYHAGDSDAAERFRTINPQLVDPSRAESATLADAQFVLAREYEFESWARLKQHIEALPHPKLDPYERVAADIVLICQSKDEDDADAWQRITDLLGRSYPYPDRRARLQRHLLVVRSPESRIEDITLADARLIIARRFGFESWAELAENVTRPPGRHSVPIGMTSTPPFYKIDWKENTIELRPPLSKKDWNMRSSTR